MSLSPIHALLGLGVALQGARAVVDLVAPPAEPGDAFFDVLAAQLSQTEHPAGEASDGGDARAAPATSDEEKGGFLGLLDRMLPWNWHEGGRFDLPALAGSTSEGHPPLGKLETTLRQAAAELHAALCERLTAEGLDPPDDLTVEIAGDGVARIASRMTGRSKAEEALNNDSRLQAELAELAALWAVIKTARTSPQFAAAYAQDPQHALNRWSGALQRTQATGLRMAPRGNGATEVELTARA